MPYFRFPLLEALAHDAESSLAGNAAFVAILGEPRDRYLLTRLYPD